MIFELSIAGHSSERERPHALIRREGALEHSGTYHHGFGGGGGVGTDVALMLLL